MIRLAFDLYESMSQRQVALHLNAQGYRLAIKSPGNRQKLGKDERFFRATDVNHIIGTKLYAGILTWAEAPRSRFTKGCEPTSHYVPDLQIVSLEQFNRCQEIRRQRSAPNTRRTTSEGRWQRSVVV